MDFDRVVLIQPDGTQTELSSGGGPLVLQTAEVVQLAHGASAYIADVGTVPPAISEDPAGAGWTPVNTDGSEVQITISTAGARPENVVDGKAILVEADE